LKRIVLLNKKEGETPLLALENFREKNKTYKDTKMTYAGRLDPMASGMLLVLLGEETKNKEKYLKLDKEYEFEILFGVATDTYDILGKVVKDQASQNLGPKELKKAVQANLKHFTGKFIQKYPMYSSKTIAGKPLFAYARSGKKVKAPEHEVFVKSLKFLKLRTINKRKLFANIEKRIKKVKGDFRQKEIMSIWRKHTHTSMVRSYYIANFKIKCGSGTYVRGIANSLGQKINIPALAFSIKRTKIGKWVNFKNNTKS